MKVAYEDIRLRPKGVLAQELMKKEIDDDCENTKVNENSTQVTHAGDEITVVPCFLSSR